MSETFDPAKYWDEQHEIAVRRLVYAESQVAYFAGVVAFQEIVIDLMEGVDL